MQELIVQHQFDLKHNMDIVKQSIVEAIKKYDVVVTDDSVKDAKEMMADINKDKKTFSDKCKEFLEIIETPIKSFKERRKDIESLYDDARNRLKVQVDKYEVEKLERIKFVISEYRNILCDEKSIERSAITINDLVMLTAVTSKNTIAAKTKQAIEQRVAVVEAEILRAKLEAEEKAKRDREIAEKARIEAEERARMREIQIREEAAERARLREIKIREEAEASKQRAVFEAEERARIQAIEEERKSSLSKAIKQSAPNYQAYEEKPNPEPVLTDDGKRVFNVTAKFKTKAPADITAETIKDKFESMFNKIGLRSGKIEVN